MGRMNKPFKNESEMIRRINSVGNECAANKTEIRKGMKQFVPQLETVESNDGYPIKTLLVCMTVKQVKT